MNLKKIKRFLYRISPTFRRLERLERKIDKTFSLLEKHNFITMDNPQDKISIQHKAFIKGKHFLFYDSIFSETTAVVAKECNVKKGVYDFSNIKFEKNDVLIDIGGNVGIISIYLALKFPFLKIYSFEPSKQNYNNFKKNLEFYNIKNVVLENKAITNDGRDIEIFTDYEHSGSGTAYPIKQQSYHIKEKSPSTTLDQVFEKYDIKQCKLLKIDCEGAEFEILYNTNKLSSVEHLRGEVHERFDNPKWNQTELENHCRQFISKENIILTNY